MGEGGGGDYPLQLLGKVPILFGDILIKSLMRTGLMSTNIVRYDSPVCSKRRGEGFFSTYTVVQ